MHVKVNRRRSRWDCDDCQHPFNGHFGACKLCSCRQYRASLFHRFLDWISW